MIVFIYLAIIELWLVGMLGFHRAKTVPQLESPDAPFASSGKVFILAGLVASAFIARLGVIAAASVSQYPFPERYAGLPLIPLEDGGPLLGHTPALVNSSTLVLTLVECLCLVYMYQTIRDKRVTRLALVGVTTAGAAMVVASLLTRAVTTTDLYYYVGLAHLGPSAYAPATTPFPGEFSAINRVWGLPILPSTYGPLWILASEVIIRASKTLAGQMEAFRAVGLAAFLACIVLLARMRVATSSIVLFGLNPALIEQYVANGHNDIVAVSLALAALACAQRRPLLAVLLGAMAGAIKVPFALVSSLAFARSSSPAWLRIVLAALTCALSLAVTVIGSKNTYFAAVRVVTVAYRSSYGVGFHAAAVCLAAASIAVALVWRRVSPTASWSMLSLAPTMFPWYAVLALPYALVEEGFLPLYLTTLPLVTLLLTTVYGMTMARHYIYVLLVTLFPLLLVPSLLILRRRDVTSRIAVSPTQP